MEVAAAAAAVATVATVAIAVAATAAAAVATAVIVCGSDGGKPRIVLLDARRRRFALSVER